MENDKNKGDVESLEFKIKQTEKHIRRMKRDVRTLLQKIPKELRYKFKL